MSVRKVSPQNPVVFGVGTEMEEPRSPAALECADDGLVDFSNNKVVVMIGACIWLVIVGANMYVIVTLVIGAKT